MAQRLNNLNKIIATLRTGASHYRQAARQTQVVENEEVYCRHAEVREHHAKLLADIIEDVGGEVQQIEPLEQARNVWSWVVARAGQTERQLVSNLEQHEQRTVSVLRLATEHPDNARDLEMLQAMQQDFEQTHAVMREKWREYTVKEGTGHDAGMAPTKAETDQPDWMKAKRSASGDQETAKSGDDADSAAPAREDRPKSKAGSKSASKQGKNGAPKASASA